MSGFDEDPAMVVERDAKIRALGPEPRWWRPILRRRWRRWHAAIMAMDVSHLVRLYRALYPASMVTELAQQQNAALSWLAKVKK